MSIVVLTVYATSLFGAMAIVCTAVLLNASRRGPARTSIVVVTVAAYAAAAAGMTLLAIALPQWRLPLLAGGIVVLTPAVAVGVRRGSRD